MNDEIEEEVEDEIEEEEVEVEEEVEEEDCSKASPCLSLSLSTPAPVTASLC